MKTNIVGWIYIASSAVLLLSFIGLSLLPILLSGGVIDSSLVSQLGAGVVALILGVLGILLGSGFRAHKRWSWYAGIGVVPLVLLGNLLALVSSFQAVLAVPIAINLFCIYALVTEKNLFLTSPTPVFHLGA
jgi:hypothetical protein